MKQLLKINNKLKICAALMIGCSVLLTSKTYAVGLGDLPSELRGLILRKLIEEGDCKAFCNARQSLKILNQDAEQDSAIQYMIKGIKQTCWSLKEWGWRR